MCRKKLIKLLNKELPYTATFSRIKEDGKNVCLENVKYKGKIVTDHVWVGLVKSLAQTKYGDEVCFLGTARTYKDNHGVRKHGLYRCHDFSIACDEYTEQLEAEAKNLKKRRGR